MAKRVHYIPTGVSKTPAFSCRSSANVVSTFDLCGVLTPLLHELNVSLSNDNNYGRASAMQGALQIVAERMHRADPVKYNPESVPRRVYDVMQLRTRVMSATYAESILVALGAEDTRMPELPGGIAAAKESVEAYLEARGEMMRPREKLRLAKSLMNFSKGYVHEFTLLDMQVTKDQLAKGRVTEAVAA